MLKKILIAIAVLVVALIGIIAMQPSEFRVARTTTIAAPAAVVFAQVNDFHKWAAWNPWGKIDLAMKASYEEWARRCGVIPREKILEEMKKLGGAAFWEKDEE